MLVHAVRPAAGTSLGCGSLPAGSPSSLQMATAEFSALPAGLPMGCNFDHVRINTRAQRNHPKLVPKCRANVGEKPGKSRWGNKQKYQRILSCTVLYPFIDNVITASTGLVPFVPASPISLSPALPSSSCPLPLFLLPAPSPSSSASSPPSF